MRYRRIVFTSLLLLVLTINYSISAVNIEMNQSDDSKTIKNSFDSPYISIETQNELILRDQAFNSHDIPNEGSLDTLEGQENGMEEIDKGSSIGSIVIQVTRPDSKRRTSSAFFKLISPSSVACL